MPTSGLELGDELTALHIHTTFCSRNRGNFALELAMRGFRFSETRGTTTTMSSRQAECSCGQLKVTCEGEPIRVSICHCLACQRRTGSPFGQQARWMAENVTVEGPATTFVRVGDEGCRITFRFCPTCGSTVYYDIDAMPGQIAVAVGAFAEPSFPAPVFSVYEARKHAWVTVPEGIEHMD